MNFTKEQLIKARSAKSAEELFAMAKDENFAMTVEEANKYFAELHKEGMLSDDELDMVAGGKGEPDPKYGKNQTVWVKYNDMGWGTVTDMYYSGVWHYKVHVEYVTLRGKMSIHDMDFTEEYLSTGRYD